MEKTFEQNLKRLEEIVAELEKGDCTLDGSMKLFEEGVAVSGECNKALENAKQKITVLKGKGNDL